jgi:hypothetical protein
MTFLPETGSRLHEVLVWGYSGPVSYQGSGRSLHRQEGKARPFSVMAHLWNFETKTKKLRDHPWILAKSTARSNARESLNNWWVATHGLSFIVQGSPSGASPTLPGVCDSSCASRFRASWPGAAQAGDVAGPVNVQDVATFEMYFLCHLEQVL